MAARRGDSKLLKDLLELKDDDVEGEQATRNAAGTSVAAVPVAEQVSIDVEVDRHPGSP
jgi:hypothetical protein